VNKGRKLDHSMQQSDFAAAHGKVQAAARQHEWWTVTTYN